MNKSLLALIIILVFIAGGAVGFFAFKTVPARDQLLNEDNINGEIIGGGEDEHGCIASAGYIWCEQKQKCLRVFEEFCPSEAEDLVKKVKENFGFEFSPAGETTFKWNTSGSTGSFTTQDIEGVQYKIENIKQADYQKIENFMKDNYEQNIGNMADGVQGGERGYIVDYMACILDFMHTEMIKTPGAPSVPANDILNVTLSCGFFNKNIASENSAE